MSQDEYLIAHKEMDYDLDETIDLEARSSVQNDGKTDTKGDGNNETNDTTINELESPNNTNDKTFINQ